MKPFVRSLQNLLQHARQWMPSVEVAVVLAIIATLAVSLFYVAGLMSPELALLLGR